MHNGRGFSPVDKKKVLVIGGGFGGVFAAKELARRGGDKFDIELINNITISSFSRCSPKSPPPPSTPPRGGPLAPVAARQLPG
jgi:2-polyprenyl-6-methoxyphenol hydroxylase-like FAD-dependent oxidoreductase